MLKTVLSFAAIMMAAVPALAADIDPERFSQSGGYSWTGFYFGASYGMAEASDTQDNFPIGPGVTIQLYSEGEEKSEGVFIGYMHQMGNLVVGAEYQHVELNIQYIAPTLGPLPIFLEDADIVKGRLGLAWGQMQVYGVAGGTYGKINVGLEDWVPMVGGGVDLALNERVIVGVEYTHSFFDEFDGEPISGEMNYLSGRVAFKF